jgi:hypothetical protein
MKTVRLPREGRAGPPYAGLDQGRVLPDHQSGEPPKVPALRLPPCVDYLRSAEGAEHNADCRNAEPLEPCARFAALPMI